MKKYILTITTVLTLLLVGCEPKEVLYDGSQTLAYFENNTAVLGVPINDMSATVEVQFSVSTLSNVDRNVTIEVVADATTALPTMYNFDTTVTVPAGSYTSSFIVTAFQQGLSQTGDNLVLKLGTVDGGGIGSPNTLSINILQTCPFDINNFVGTYSQLSGFNAPPTTPSPDVIIELGPEPNTLILTNLYAAGRRAVIELDGDSDNSAITHRSLEFGAVFQNSNVGLLYTTEQFASAGQNSFNTCTNGIELNYLRRNAASVFGGEYRTVLTKK